MARSCRGQGQAAHSSVGQRAMQPGATADPRPRGLGSDPGSQPPRRVSWQMLSLQALHPHRQNGTLLIAGVWDVGEDRESPFAAARLA